MIKNIAYQNDVTSVFKLKVTNGAYTGIYEIKQPSEFNSIDCKLSIDDESFNVNNFILGDTVKIKFVEYYDEDTYNLIKNVYDEQGGDGEILFLWQEIGENEVIDVIGENYALNLNKYNHKYEKSRWRIETEVKKRESQNKLLTREDVTVNLFSNKDLDGNEISPVETNYIFYKEQPRRFTNFYFYKYGQFDFSTFNKTFPVFTRSDNAEFGDNTNVDSGWSYNLLFQTFKGSIFWSNTFIDNISIELSNFDIASDSEFKLYLYKWNTPNSYTERILLDESSFNQSDNFYHIKIVNKTIKLGSLNALDNIDIQIEFNDNTDHFSIFLDKQASIELHTDRIIPIRRTKAIYLKDAVNQVSKMLTSNGISLQSSIIDNGGYYENTAVSSGIFLRGISELYLGENRFNTSFKTILYDGILKLMALGFDVQNDKLVIESIDYFFKDLVAYDFTDKKYLHESLEITNDSEETYNVISFGSKKYSTNKKDDILNFNTQLEATTPIKSIKNKFDKTSEAIIDDEKIQELIADKSSKTSDNDDDLILIDLVNINNYVDEGILTNCVHRIENGKLVLVCIDTPFDMLAVQIGDTLEIISGLNIGSYTILEIDKAKLVLNKTSGIQEGITDTIVKFTLQNITKNRLNEGFEVVNGIKGNGASNLRHNPKYHMARWFSFYGGGLDKKLDSENIIVTNYKNNGNVEIQANSPELDNEYQGLVKLNANELLGRLRYYKRTFFSGEDIKVTLKNVLFSEFMQLYNNWRYGINNDDTKSRGYINLNINDVIVSVYLFGDDALSFNMSKNELTINGKIKNNEYNQDKFKIFDYTFDYTFE